MSSNFRTWRKGLKGPSHPFVPGPDDEALSLARFMSFVLPEPNSGCWLWTGDIYAESNSYGRFHYGGLQHRAHCWAYKRFVGPIPSGLLVCHTCDVPSCVNPKHLWLGTPGDNHRDCVRKGRKAITRIRGTRLWSTKLTEGKVREIRSLRAVGHSTKDLAQRFGVIPNTILDVVNRKTWWYLDGERP